MGIFNSLFGSSGSDKADKMRQAALDAFNSIKTPELQQLQVQLNNYVNAGKLTPEQAEAQLLSSNAFNEIVTDPSYVGAQKQALQQLQSIGTQGGLTAVDKAQLQDVTNQQNQQAKSRTASVLQDAQRRGTGNSALTSVNQLLEEQAAADRASQQGTGVAAQAQTRALQAMQAAGQQGGALESQQYGEQANKAQAQNAIDLFNKQTLNQTNLYNTQTSNAAQAANLANEQSINNANTQTQNANKEYNAQQVQQQYNDALQKANGTAGIYNNWASDATKQAATEKAADMAITSGLVKAGGQAIASAFGAPPSMTSGSMEANGGQQNKNITEDQLPGGFAHGGMVPENHPDHPQHMAMGGHLHCYAHGGEAYHHPECYMSDGGTVDVSSDTAHVEPKKEEPKPERSWAEKLADLLSSHADIANELDKSNGGKVPGKAPVKGDSPKNDIVDAKLSPGEVIVPRSALSDDEEFNHFMEKFKPSNQHKMAKGGMVQPNVPMEAKALANLHTRIEHLEGGK